MYSNIALSSSSTNSLTSTVSRSLLDLTSLDMTASVRTTSLQPPQLKRLAHTRIHAYDDVQFDVNAMILPCADWYIETDGIEEGRDGIDDYCVDLAEVPGVPLESPRFFPSTKRRSIKYARSLSLHSSCSAHAHG
jgi:hypothetical protein